MAKETNEKPVEAEKPVDDGLVEMYKGRESLRVHPTCVKEHEQCGWSRA